MIFLATLGWVGWNHFAGTAVPQAPAAVPAAVPESLLIVNTFETKEGISPYSGDGAELAISSVPGGVSGNALAIWFSYPGGRGFWGVNIPAAKDCRAYTGVRLSVKSAEGMSFRLILRDAEEYWESPVTTGPEYREISVPFKDFTFRKDFNKKVDGVLDLAGIGGVEIIQLDTGTGTIYMDNLEFYGPVPGGGQ
jgi:hypothetical protein